MLPLQILLRNKWFGDRKKKYCTKQLVLHDTNKFNTHITNLYVYLYVLMYWYMYLISFIHIKLVLFYKKYLPKNIFIESLETLASISFLYSLNC